MPTGPKGEKRPADVIGNAVHVMRIATGEADEQAPLKEEPQGASPWAKKAGKKGGEARAAALSDNERRRIAREAAKARWRRRNA